MICRIMVEIRMEVEEGTADDTLMGVVGAVKATLAGCRGVDVTARAMQGSEAWTMPYGTPLRRQERKIAWMIASGARRAQIAEQLGISVKTFDTHRLNLLAKLRCANEVQLVRLAIREGWMTP